MTVIMKREKATVTQTQEQGYLAVCSVPSLLKLRLMEQLPMIRDVL